MSKKLSIEPYKGVRDFYPEDQAVQNYIFKKWRQTVESFGFIEYNASILEPAELYKAKSGEEIVNDQTYTFTDRGEREVTLRPEMTPSVARMVAAKKRELSFPLRWYSIQNFFRYERPQRGRVREFWQLNCDIFGVDSISADVEIIQLAYNIMKSFGARDGDFKIYINNAKAFRENIISKLNNPDQFTQAKKLIDAIEKMSTEEFDAKWKELSNQPFEKNPSSKSNDSSSDSTFNLISVLNNLGISNVEYNPILTRGFDYYTGTVFEVYDTNPENKRALFGGGRFDDLLGLFGEDKVPAVGFGMGDVTMRDFLETRNLLPQFVSPAQLYICNAGVTDEKLFEIASQLREKGIAIAIDLSDKKIGDQIKKAVRDAIEFAAVIGENELNSGEISIRHLASEKEEKVKYEKVADYIKNF